MEEEKIPTIYHKIEPNRKIRVFKTTHGDNVFYKTQITQKNYDNTTSKYYIGLNFKKGVDLSDPDGKGVDIIIKNAYENFRENPKDKYNPILYLMVTDFEVQERQDQIEAQAYDEYRSNLNDDIGQEVTINDDFLD